MANETSYDKISLLRGTEQELKTNIDKIKNYELMIAKDTRKAFVKMDDGTLKSIVPDCSEIKQLPLDSIYGSISVRNGRLYTSGAFNNIHGRENANVLEYGDSKIITTPDNSFNAIVEGNKLYVGPTFTYDDTLIDSTLPKIPQGYTFPDGALSFDGTEGLNFTDYSYVFKNFNNGVQRWASILWKAKLGGEPSRLLSLNPVGKTPSTFNGDIVYSALYSDPSITVETSSSKTPRLTLKHYEGSAGAESFEQFICYQGSRTQAELEAELAKNLYIEGEVDVISQIQTSMKVGAILGKRPQGNIDDGTLHKVDEVWYSNKLFKYYECITENSDNYVDTNKWKERSLMSVPYISISGYKVEVV